MESETELHLIGSQASLKHRYSQDLLLRASADYHPTYQQFPMQPQEYPDSQYGQRDLPEADFDTVDE